jgi:hypothetical protein
VLGIAQSVLTQTVAAEISTHSFAAYMVGYPVWGRLLDVLPHLVQGHCADQTVLYSAGEQVGTGLLHQHAHDVGSGAEMS